MVRLSETINKEELKYLFEQAEPWALRNTLPYGVWTCEDGTKVLFNRAYEPIFKMSPEGNVNRADPMEWIKWVKQEYFYNDSNPPFRYFPGENQRLRKNRRETLKKCVSILIDWGVWDKDLGYWSKY